MPNTFRQGERSKYGNKKIIRDGIKFDSKKEYARYGELKMLERAKVITDLKLQPEFKLEVNGQLVCKYRGDFSYLMNGKLWVEDAKSPITRKEKSYRIKLKLLKAIHGIEIKEV